MESNSSYGERYYAIGGITVRVTAPCPVPESTFRDNIRPFEVASNGSDVVDVQYQFVLPPINPAELDAPLYRRPPWSIHPYDGGWAYLTVVPMKEGERIDPIILFSKDYQKATVCHNGADRFRRGKMGSLTSIQTDQIFLNQVLADRMGAFFHSSGVVLNGKGILFVGHSEAGKSTMARMLQDQAQILCDDRIIVRKWPDGFWIHGTWSHGEIDTVSPDGAPLAAICFLEKADENRLIPVSDTREGRKRLLPCLVRVLETPYWWERMLDMVTRLSKEVPCYRLRFDQTGDAVNLLTAI